MPAELTIATLNLFNNREGRWVERAPLVREQAVALSPDVLALQEVDVRSRQVEDLRAALGDDYVAVTLPNPDPASRKSLAIVTCRDVEREDHCFDLGAGDMALRVVLDGAAAPLEVVTTHLHFDPSARGSAVRGAQIRRLLAWLGPIDGRAIALAGDFNARPSGETVAALKRCFRSAHEVVHGREPAFTHPTPLLGTIDARAAFGAPVLPEGGQVVDYVFVTPAIDVLGCRVAFDRPAPNDPALFPSDHVGLVARLACR